MISIKFNGIHLVDDTLTRRLRWFGYHVSAMRLKVYGVNDGTNSYKYGLYSGINSKQSSNKNFVLTVGEISPKIYDYNLDPFTVKFGFGFCNSQLCFYRENLRTIRLRVCFEQFKGSLNIFA